VGVWAKYGRDELPLIRTLVDAMVLSGCRINSNLTNNEKL
jgi:hypothetical protein